MKRMVLILSVVASMVAISTSAFAACGDNTNINAPTTATGQGNGGTATTSGGQQGYGIKH